MAGGEQSVCDYADYTGETKVMLRHNVKQVLHLALFYSILFHMNLTPRIVLQSVFMQICMFISACIFASTFYALK